MMMFVGGSYASLTYFGTRPSDRAQIWGPCADFFWTHPTPGGFRGLSIVKNLSRRTAPKFGTHVRIDTLTLKKTILTLPTPRGLNCLARLALARERTPSCIQVDNNPCRVTVLTTSPVRAYHCCKHSQPHRCLTPVS